VGRQTLDVARHLAIPVIGLGSRRPSADLASVAKAFPEARVAVAGGSGDERRWFADEVGVARVAFGGEALTALASTPGAVIMNAVVGVAGLPHSLAALTSGNRLALANKESMVVAGDLMRSALTGGSGELIPVDSEHSAILQCLLGEDRNDLRRIILTASGGPFRGWSLDQIQKVTPEQALRHPNWVMGRRITVDSATLVNKALEVIETHHLFGARFDQIKVLVHPQSVVHSMVEFSDGSIKAHLGRPDMRIPIEYALTHPRRGPALVEPFDWRGAVFGFEEPDQSTFPALALGFAAGRAGGNAPAVFNAADEVAVDAFLRGRLGFTGIARVIAETLETVEHSTPSNLDDVIETDRAARATAAAFIAGAC
jgi:1-deoxy-D-xylulose-5-phosphate reductoisomerase